ncbi:MAG: hypothetical protein DMG33_06080 [Acidobacteria bacterium]|nr:MAG: hypothetical protein DMG33_06080 [Acidobacteriota bacterium]
MIQETARRLGLGGLALAVATFSVQQAQGYSFNQVVPDVRQPASLSGGSACPVRAHRPTGSGSVAVQWSTAFGTNPVAILTQDQTTSGRLNEIEQAIQQSLGVWTGVSGTTLTPASPAPLARTAVANACGSDGLNSICFDQNDAAFTPGVLAFTRVITADRIGEQIGSAISAEVGQILDADIYFSSSDPRTAFATPLALFTNPNAYDLESVLTHELGHFLGFSHSAVWSAIMFPFAPAPGTYAGPRPTAQQPDAPLAEDDRTGLRALYPDPNDMVHTGTITGRILAANPLSLLISPPGVTGIFGAQVVAVDASSGAAMGGAIGGWSCSGAGPAQFDGTYVLERLAAGGGTSYKIYAEPLNGAVNPAAVSNATSSLCRNAMTDAGWPAAASCIVPPVDTSLTTHMRPSP